VQSVQKAVSGHPDNPKVVDSRCSPAGQCSFTCGEHRSFFAMDLSPSEKSILGCFSLMNSFQALCGDAVGVCVLSLSASTVNHSRVTPPPLPVVVVNCSEWSIYLVWRWLSFLSKIATKRPRRSGILLGPNTTICHSPHNHRGRAGLIPLHTRLEAIALSPSFPI
jgi:hypothetical protein